MHECFNGFGFCVGFLQWIQKIIIWRKKHCFFLLKSQNNAFSTSAGYNSCICNEGVDVVDVVAIFEFERCWNYGRLHMGAIAVWANKYLKKIKQCVQLVSQLIWWYVQLVLRILSSITDARYFRSGWIINGWSESTLDNWQYQSHIGQSLHAIWVRKLPEASNKSHQYWSNWNVPVCTLHTLCSLVWVCPVKLIGTI